MNLLLDDILDNTPNTYERPTDERNRDRYESPHRLKQFSITDHNYHITTTASLYDETGTVGDELRFNDALPRHEPVKETLTVEHPTYQGHRPSLYMSFDYTKPRHIITHEEPSQQHLWEALADNPQRHAYIHAHSKAPLPGQHTSPDQARLNGDSLLDYVTKQFFQPSFHINTAEIRQHKQELTMFLTAYINHLRRPYAQPSGPHHHE